MCKRFIVFPQKSAGEGEGAEPQAAFPISFGKVRTGKIMSKRPMSRQVPGCQVGAPLASGWDFWESEPGNWGKLLGIWRTSKEFTPGFWNRFTIPWSSLVQRKVSRGRGWNEKGFKVPFTPKHPMTLWFFRMLSGTKLNPRAETFQDPCENRVLLPVTC